MRVCPKCGYEDAVHWRTARARRNVDVARYEEFKTEFPTVELLAGAKPIKLGTYAYKRTKAGIWVERQSIIENPAWDVCWAPDYEGHHNNWYPFGKAKDKQQSCLLEVETK